MVAQIPYSTLLSLVPELCTELLQEFYTTIPHELSSIDPVVSQSVDLVKDLTLLGGKRLRPMFTWAGMRAVWESPDYQSEAFQSETSREPGIDYLRAASSLEFIQACALIHDDIIDNSDTRRGSPATHRKFQAIHRENNWLGDPVDFGNSQAILAGDLTFSWADDCLNFSGLSATTLYHAREPWAAMRSEVIAGQILDISFEHSGLTDPAQSEKINRYKTAAYTVERPLHLGVALAGGTDKLVEILRTWGTNIGLAFQLQDDLLGVLGDATLTGKPAGDDLRSGKRTYLVNTSVALAAQSDLITPENLIQRLNSVRSDHDIAELLDIMDSLGAIDGVKRHIEELTASANDVLLSAGLGESITQELIGVSEKLITRQF